MQPNDNKNNNQGVPTTPPPQQPPLVSPAPITPTTQPPTMSTQTTVKPEDPSNSYSNTTQTQSVDPGKTLTIVSLGFTIILASLVGLILAIIANIKSGRAGYKNNLAKILIAINSVFLLIGALLLVLFLILYLPILHARGVAFSYISAVRSGECSEALGYTDTAEPDKESFIKFCESMRQNIGDSEESIKYEKQDGKYGFVYKIDNGDSKYMRVVVENGKVTDFITSNNEPGVFGSSSDATTDQVSSGAEDKAPAVKSCEAFVPSDFTPLLAKASEIANLTSYSDNVFFEPDSTSYQYPEVTKNNLAKYGVFHKTTNKSYIITLKGSVYSDYNTEEGKKLSQERSNKVKSDLVSSGVPANLVIIGEPNEYPYGQSSNYDPSVFRNVKILTTSACQSNM